MKRLIKWILLTVIALVAALGILLFTLDLGFMRGTVEKRISQAVGRDFAIDGDFSVRLGRELVIRARDVRLGNAAWAGDESFMDVGQFEAVVDTRSLWNGPLTVRRTTISQARVSLQRNEEGQGNWQFASGAEAEAPGQRDLMLIESLSLSDSEFDFTSPRLDRPVQATIGSLDHRLGADGLLQANLDGSLSGRPVLLKVSTGPYADLLVGENIRFDGGGSLGDVELSGNAVFDNLWAPSRPVVDLQMSGPDFEDFMDMLGIEGLGTGDLALQISTAVMGDTYTVKVAGNLGNFDIDVAGEMPSIQEVGKAAFEARVDGRNLGRLARLAGINNWPEQPFTLDATVQRPGGGLQIERFDLSLGANRIDLSGSLPSYPALTDGRFEVHAGGPEFGAIARLGGLENLPDEPFEFHSTLSMPADVLVVEQFDMQLAGADIRLKGRVPGFPELAGADITLKVVGPELEPFQAFFGLQSPLTGAFDIGGSVSVVEDQTVLDLRYQTTLGRGRISGNLGSGEGMVGTELSFTAEGPDASALGRLMDLEGLPADSWAYLTTFSIRDPAFFDVDTTRFQTSGLTMELNGRIGAESLNQGTDARFSIRGDRLADFQNMFGEGVSVPDQPFKISGGAKAQPGAWGLENVNGNLGSTSFRVNGSLGTGAGLAGTDLVVEASGDDFGRILDLPGHARLPDGPFTGSLRFSLAEERLRVGQLDVGAGPFKLKLDADVPWPFDLSNGRFSIDVSGIDITRVLPELAGFDLAAEDYEARFAGEWHEDRISIRQGTLRIGESSLFAQGGLDLPPNLSATDLVFEVHSPDLSKLGTLDGVRWGFVPLTLRSTFTGTQTRFRMDQFRARLGDSEFEGAFSVDFEEALPNFYLQVSTPTLDLRPFLGEPDGEDLEVKPPPEEDVRLIPEQEFPMAALTVTNGDFSITAGKVLLRRSTLINSTLIGAVHDGALNISNLGIDGHGGRLASTLALQPREDGGADARLTIRSKGLVLDFTGLPEQERDQLPAFDIDLDLRGSGKTIREAAASLNGRIIANSPGGKVKNLDGYGLEGLFLAKVISTVSPGAARREEINISCFAAATEVRDGVLLLEPGMAIQSDRLNLFAGGRINLGSEKLDVNFRAQTRKAVDVSAGELFSPYVKLSGTMANPSVALDTKGTLLSGGAAYLSGGLSILAKKALDQLGGTKDPCADYLREIESAEP